MKFSYNMRLIMNAIDCSNNDLAVAANVDPTLISKFRNDIRIPTDGSKALNAIIDGLYKLTIEKNKVKKIKKLCNNDEKKLFDSISKYFITNSNNIKLQKENNVLIGNNLDTLMKTLNITNVMLSKYLNKDGSLISKYKANKRYIMRNDPLIEEMCDYFYKFIIDNDLSITACTLLKISDISNLKTDILKYLFTEYSNNSSVHSFLENLSDFKLNDISSIPSVNALVSDEILNSKKEQYIGTIEFRNAVKRFLASTCLNTQKKTLYLYSDESMRWMYQDKVFYNTWKILMANTLLKRNKIKIIHNINRNPDEMFRAIEGWLPLYMMGLIEPYYNVINNNNTLFNHTLFISENTAAISSITIKNNKKNNNIYNYTENNNIINNYKDQFMELINNSKELLKVYINNEINQKLKDSCEYHIYSDKLDNINILFKNDETHVLVLKTDTPKILFEFTYPKMIDAFKNYVSKN